MTPFEDFNYAPQSYIVPEVDDPDFLVKMTQYLSYIGLALQKKLSSIQSLDETVISTDFWLEQTDRPQTVYRKMVYFGSLPNAGEKSVPANLNPGPNWRCVHLYGGATIPGSVMVALPHSHPNAANSIALRYDLVNDAISITTGVDRSSFVGIVTLEYIKNFN